MDRYLELLVTLGFLGGLLWAMMKFMLRDIHRDLADIRSEISEIKTEMKIDRSAVDQRLDYLYRTLIDLVKEKKI